MRTLLLLYMILISGFTIAGQTSDSEVNGDTLTERYYYKNGSLEMVKRSIKGRDRNSYINVQWYYKNGNPRTIDYYNGEWDSSFYLSGRRNGSIEFRIKRVNGNFEKIQENRKGELVERTYSFSDSDSIFLEKYKDGKLIETIGELSIPKDSGLDTVRYYRGAVGDNSAVIVMETPDGMEYLVNDRKMTEEEYRAYEVEYSEYWRRREPKHFYQEFTADSLLVHEGVFTEDLPCGEYREYYESGTIKIRGWYDMDGERTGTWHYYNPDGQFIHSEYYENGNLEE